MTYAIVYKDSGDFLADFESLDEARSALHDLLQERPSVREHIGLMEFDDAGHPTRALDVESAAQPA
jgi:hypothetical protein